MAAIVGSDSSHQIEQKNEQVIGVTGGRRQRFFVSNFKINQPRAIRFLAVDHIGHRGVAMRPATV